MCVSLSIHVCGMEMATFQWHITDTFMLMYWEITLRICHIKTAFNSWRRRPLNFNFSFTLFERHSCAVVLSTLKIWNVFWLSLDSSEASEVSTNFQFEFFPLRHWSSWRRTTNDGPGRPTSDEDRRLSPNFVFVERKLKCRLFCWKNTFIIIYSNGGDVSLVFLFFICVCVRQTRQKHQTPCSYSKQVMCRVTYEVERTIKFSHFGR